MMRLLQIIVIILLITTACCSKKGPLPVLHVDVVYKNLNEEENLYAVRTHKTDLSQVIDTVFLTELNAANAYTFSLEIRAATPSFLFFLENSADSNTLSHIEVLKMDCRGSVEEFQYRFNGVVMNERKVVVE
jgi:predicted small lipoprotein YifL